LCHVYQLDRDSVPEPVKLVVQQPRETTIKIERVADEARSSVHAASDEFDKVDRNIATSETC